MDITAMLNLNYCPGGRPLRLLCVGAHSDDIEIGCGATLLGLIERCPGSEVRWVVFSASPDRAAEARLSAERFLQRAGQQEVAVHGFRDGHFPTNMDQIKSVFEGLKSATPDLIFTHYREDRHQDHRVISDVTWNTFRNHLVLEYEIPKYDGDLGSPNVYIPVSADHLALKTRHLLECFTTQRGKHWFDEETFRALPRIRGMECNSPTRYAEAFYGRKVVILPTT